MTRKRLNTILVIIIAVLLVTVSIGYSALSRVLNISGTASYQHNVKASYLSYDNTNTHIGCLNAQCMIDCLANTNLCPALASFKVNILNASGSVTQQKTYNFAQGMTFSDWISSPWNVDNLYQGNGVDTIVYDATHISMRYSTDEHVHVGDTIIASYLYHFPYETCCFDPETLIQIDLEGHTKKIKDFEVGDTIVVQSSITGKKYVTTVLKEAHEHPNTFDFGEVILEDGTKLRFNTYHPIYTIEGFKTLTKFKNLPKLTEKDIVLLSNGTKMPIKEIKRYNVEKEEMTYNLLIKGINEYFLEDEYGYFANGVLVHHGIEEYDDEAHYRLKHQDRCVNKELYKNFEFDKASDEEIIKFLASLKIENEDAFKEYIKYYISPEQYLRYAKFAKKVKERISELESAKDKVTYDKINRYKEFKVRQ